MEPISQAKSSQLLNAAKDIADKAYAPYSKFYVGAALLTQDGQIFIGCNVENASYGLTLCAERNAISSMVAAGYLNFVAMAVYAKNAKECYPCGACRQWIFEFAPDCILITEDKNDEPAYITIKDLLPKAFGPSVLL